MNAMRDSSNYCSQYISDRKAAVQVFQVSCRVVTKKVHPLPDRLHVHVLVDPDQVSGATERNLRLQRLQRSHNWVIVDSQLWFIYALDKGDC